MDANVDDQPLASSRETASERKDTSPLGNFLTAPLRQNRPVTIAAATALIVIVVVANWRSADEVPLGFLYLFPMLMLGRVLRPWQTIVAAALCTYLTEVFDPFAWEFRNGVTRDVLYFVAFFTIGIFVYQVSRNRAVMDAQLRQIEIQSAARLEAEQQLLSLIESSPAAIITTKFDGTILMANEAAQRLLCGTSSPRLVGRTLHDFLPSLLHVTQRDPGHHSFRTVMQARGRRMDGDTFLAEVCFSTYSTVAGPRFTAMILDSSEELRSREESSLHQMLAGSRLAVSAMSHEIRNVCGAITVVHRNLSHAHGEVFDKDFEALGNLVLALERIAAVDLRPYPEQLARVDIHALLEDLRIVIAPSLQDCAATLVWNLEPHLPLVWADGTNLMQVFLNLTTNSIRALSQVEYPAVLEIRAFQKETTVIVEVQDNGGGVPNVEQLFRPFQEGAQNTGLGLYLARAFTRAFRGDLQYRAVPNGACFMVKLQSVEDEL